METLAAETEWNDLKVLLYTSFKYQDIKTIRGFN
jgi:hypothetical protein